MSLFAEKCLDDSYLFFGLFGLWRDNLYNPRMEHEDKKLCLTPPVLSCHETDGFDKSDIFGYAEFGGRLANVVRNLQTPLVLALTGGWGSGKSVFAKQLAGELRKQWANQQDNPENEKIRAPEDAPVICFDAFANDHQDNALFALAGEVMKFIGRREGATNKMKDSAKRIAKGVGGVLAEGVARYATGGLAGAKDIEATMQSALEKRMEEAKLGRDAVEEFQKALESAAGELGNGHPLVFIVDELDRCRPDSALELLEKIKHLFSVPNVCFLMVTNLEQFRAVVERAYGYNKDEARVYLDKFFHHVFWLPEAKTEDGKIATYVRYLWERMNLPHYGRDENKDFLDWLIKLAGQYDFSLRDIERMFTNVSLACAAVKHANVYLVFALTGLCAMRKAAPELYQKAVLGQASEEDFRKFMQWDQWGNLGILPDAMRCFITGGRKPDTIEPSEWREITRYSEQMPEIAMLLQNFDVQNEFWLDLPPAPEGRDSAEPIGG